MHKKNLAFFKYRKNLLVTLFFIITPFLYSIIKNNVYSDKEYSAFYYQKLNDPDIISLSQDKLERNDFFLDCIWQYEGDILQDVLEHNKQLYVNLPHKYKGQGKASYSIKIDGLIPGNKYGLLLPFFKSGCIVFIDDTPLAWLGIPNPDIPNSKPMYKPGLYSFIAKQECIKITIRTENRYTSSGGISQVPIFGLTDNLRDRQIKSNIFDIIASLVFLFPSIFFFFLYLKQKRHFLLTSAIFFLVLPLTFFLCSSNTIVLQVFPFLPTIILIKITYVLLLLIALLLTNILFYLDTNRKLLDIYRTIMFLQIFLCLLTILWPVKYIQYFQEVYLLSVFIFLILGIIRLVASFFENKCVLSYIVPATVIICHCFLTNFLYRMQVSNIRSFYPLGYSTSYNPFIYSFETFINIFFECFAFGNLLYNTHKYILPFFNDSKKLTYETDKKTEQRIDYLNYSKKKFDLTSRESQVLALLLFDALTYKDIAHRLSISENTVKKYVSSILLKANTESRYELVANYISMEGLSSK